MLKGSELLVLLAISSVSTLSITKVEQSSVEASLGGSVVISCAVNHYSASRCMFIHNNRTLVYAYGKDYNSRLYYSDVNTTILPTSDNPSSSAFNPLDGIADTSFKSSDDYDDYEYDSGYGYGRPLDDHDVAISYKPNGHEYEDSRIDLAQDPSFHTPENGPLMPCAIEIKYILYEGRSNGRNYYNTTLLD